VNERGIHSLSILPSLVLIYDDSISHELFGFLQDRVLDRIQQIEKGHGTLLS